MKNLNKINIHGTTTPKLNMMNAWIPTLDTGHKLNIRRSEDASIQFTFNLHLVFRREKLQKIKFHFLV